MIAQSQRWRLAIDLREYLEATQEVPRAPDGEREEGESWLAWAHRRVESLDPLWHRIAMPAEVEATAEAVQPFLHGWSPYGPRRDMRW